MVRACGLGLGVGFLLKHLFSKYKQQNNKMKKLNKDNLQTKIFNNHGAFFCFSNSQFDEQKIEGVKYEDCGGGLVAPVGSGSHVLKDLELLHDECIEYEKENNTLKVIIWDSLANYECQITWDFSDALEALKPYGITSKQVGEEWGEYFKHCIDNNYF